MNTPKTRQIGKILLDLGLITAKQLEHALRSQQYIKHSSELGQILVTLGYITDNQLAVAIALQKGQARIKTKH